MTLLEEYIRSVLLEYREITESMVFDWLIEHYSDIRKLPKNRIEALLPMKDVFPFLRPPKSKFVYRGLYNVSDSDLHKMMKSDKSDPVRDKSWTVSKNVAISFAKARFTNEDLDEEKNSVIIVGRTNDNMLLNWKKISKIKKIVNTWNDIWEETLYNSIVYEKEIVVLGHVEIVKIITV